MDRKTIGVGVAVFAIIGIAILSNIALSKAAALRGTAYNEPYPPAPAIDLQQADGKPFRLSEQRGKIVLIFFGYTSCPDVCPTTLAELNASLVQLGERASQVQVVLVSVDPDRDTSAGMQEYVTRFNPAFIGLSGATQDLESIWKSYGVFREVVPGTSPTNYIVNHTARTTLIDQHGNMRLSYGYQTPPEDIAYDIDRLLDQ